MSKRMSQLKSMVPVEIKHDATEAIKLVKTLANAKFPESIDVAVKLGIDARKSDQNVRGVSNLPHGVGKKIKIAVFADVADKEAIIAAGALKVGMEDLVEDMKAGQLDYDRVIATPAAMKLVGKLGQLLGPKGLMPNPKTGSVTNDVVVAVKQAAKGQAVFRTDKAGIIHCSIGRATFDDAHLVENLTHLLKDLKRLKPSASKGIYLVSCSISATMSPAVQIDIPSLPI